MPSRQSPDGPRQIGEPSADSDAALWAELAQHVASLAQMIDVAPGMSCHSDLRAVLKVGGQLLKLDRRDTVRRSREITSAIFSPRGADAN